MRFSLSTPKETTRGLKSIWESKMGTTSSERIIQYAYLALKALDIFYRKNRSAVEGLTDRNGHKRKVLGERKSVSSGVEQTKGKGRECELTKICSRTVIF